ncbi:DNA-binding transcriptional LysR family regulator [Pseudochelatococcus lubricantis]|uniref:DNA-binding transcriptional LysR family regulator n=1 Tax=Pseudochelatococcus lubricantis TaxID=1538102 RepID=A0ABX0V420_9HYPH|nr:DNA-binding transcriptional LysR family regulator [Pseudochelatococcus lubricantis]
MANPGTPTFEQLRIFLAVVDAGSFAGAARKLNRAVSVVSYGADSLEAQLGLDLFERMGTRKPKLTAAGRVVLAEARALAQGIDGLRAKVKGLLDGLEGGGGHRGRRNAAGRPAGHGPARVRGNVSDRGDAPAR